MEELDPYISMYALHGILPDNHLRIWERFVMACRILCQPVISKQEISKADALLLHFCTGMEKLYGKKGLTCNMHLHCHLRSVLLDYGPVFGFWLFSFERCNGQIGSVLTNNRSVEIQFMRNFVKERFLMPCTGNLPTIYQEQFGPVFDRCKSKGSTLTGSTVQQYYLLSQLTNFANVLWYDNNNVRVPASYKTDMLTSEDIDTILIVYQTLYPGGNISISDLHFTIKKFTSIFVGTEKFGSRAERRALRSARVLASWHGNEGLISAATSTLCPGIVDYFICHQVTIDGVDREHYFACVEWFKKHPSLQRLGNFNTLSVWDGSDFEPGGPSRFLPVHRIHSLFTGAYISLDNVKLMTVCPIPRRANIFLSN